MPDRSSRYSQYVQAGIRHIRLQRLASVAGILLRVLAGFLAAGSLILWVAPAGAPVLLWAGAALGVSMVLTLFAAWAWPVEGGRAARLIDRRFELPDHVLTAHELDARGESVWRDLQHADTAKRLQSVDWNVPWPVLWPRFSALMAAACMALAVLAGWRLVSAVAPSAPAIGEPSARAAELEKLLADWEKVAEESEDAELKHLVSELQPLRGQLRQADDREAMQALSELENKLESLRAEAGKDSLEGAAGEMAAAFEQVDGMSALTAALRRKDFKAASEQAAEEARKLAQPGVKVPPGALREGSLQRIQRASEKLAETGNASAAEALRQIGENARRGDALQMGQGMEAMSKVLAREAGRQAARQRLTRQLAQVAEFRMGEGSQGLGARPGQEMGGGGAGSESDPDRFKDPTELHAARSAEKVAGAAAEGESEVETVASDQAGREAPRQERAAQFAEYERLSQQAIADESLPLAYRETIRKYFEAIRPSQK